MLKKIGSAAFNPDLVTHIEPHHSGLVVHFVGGANKLFTGEDAETVKKLLVKEEKHEDE